MTASTRCIVHGERSSRKTIRSPAAKSPTAASPLTTNDPAGANGAIDDDDIRPTCNPTTGIKPTTATNPTTSSPATRATGMTRQTPHTRHPKPERTPPTAELRHHPPNPRHHDTPAHIGVHQHPHHKPPAPTRTVQHCPSSPHTHLMSSSPPTTTTPPHDATAEQLVIGSVLLAPALLLELGSLTPEAFYLPEHQAIYTAITHLEINRHPIDPQSVWRQLVERHDNRGRINTPTYLHECMQHVTSAAAAPYHARTIRDMAAKRHTLAFATRLAATSTDPSTHLQDIVTHLTTTSRELVDSMTATTIVPTMGELLQDAVEYVEQLASGDGQKDVLSTGFIDLDRILNGMRPGQLITIAARPGVGKTSLALDMLRHNAIRANRSVLMFSLEMSARELVLRLISAESGVPSKDMLSGKTSDAHWAAIAQCYQKIVDAKISIIDDATVTMADAARLARLIEREKGGIDLIIIDYLQLMNSGRKSESRQLEVADISRSAKILAKEMGVPVIALSQVNRAAEARNDKKPVLSDLRDSGAIEQDSDVVLLIHREEIYVPETPRVGEADVMVAKNRSGPLGNCVLTFVNTRSCFANAAHVPN